MYVVIWLDSKSVLQSTNHTKFRTVFTQQKVRVKVYLVRCYLLGDMVIHVNNM